MPFKKVRSLRLLFAMGCLALGQVRAEEQSQTPQPGTQWSDGQVKAAVAPLRVGRKLTPKTWPNGAKVAVCLSWDMDNETIWLRRGVTSPIELSVGEYGATEGLRRIMALYDRYDIPGSFYIPAVAAQLAPELISELKKRPRHEVGIHGWIHEMPGDLNDEANEERLLHKAIDFWSQALGKRPVGYRAPGWDYSKYTFDLIRKAGFSYDSSAMGMDEPYELNSNGQPTGMVEIPIDWILDDAAYFGLGSYVGPLPSPEQVFKVFQDEFDVAYQEGTLFMLTMHPMITGHRSRMLYLDKLVAHMKTKPGVWFATARDIASYVKQQGGMYP